MNKIDWIGLLEQGREVAGGAAQKIVGLSQKAIEPVARVLQEQSERNAVESERNRIESLLNQSHSLNIRTRQAAREQLAKLDPELVGKIEMSYRAKEKPVVMMKLEDNGGLTCYRKMRLIQTDRMPKKR